MFIGSLRSTMKKNMLLGPKTDGIQQTNLSAGDFLCLDPCQPVRYDYDQLIFQEIGRQTPTFWCGRPGGKFTLAKEDVLRKVIDRALYHNECPSCGLEMITRSGGYLSCSGAPSCITRLSRQLDPPLGEPLWMVLRRAVEWESLAPEQVVSTSQELLHLSDEDSQYLQYMFLPLKPQDHVSLWVKFLVRRQMCWGEGARMDLFERKQKWVKTRERRKEEKDKGKLEEEEREDSDTVTD